MKLLTFAVLNLVLMSNIQAETKTVVIPVEISHGAIEALTPKDSQSVQIEVSEEETEDSEEIAAN